MFLSQAQAEGGLLRGAGPCLLPGRITFRRPGHPPLGSHVERGDTGPPMPADLCSSGRDRQPAMTPKTLKHNTPIRANILHIFCINPRRRGLSGRLPARSREGYVGRFPHNQWLCL
jgi:hypothetical protein